ncbi:MAG: glycerol-3-phosphate 1-O-acyltransferase PlsY [PVC group bacterium]|nr:glycerol-3-phosphate 1-O-acyltransferase PlsY [PVC group bacterium]
MIKLLTGIIFSYLCGAIPAAYIAAKFLKGVDIREYGSGNVGATNALRTLGKLPGILVLLFDILKGVFAVTILSRIFMPESGFSIELVKAVLGVSVVSGHVFNVFLRMKGGKGVATSAGVLLGLAPTSILMGAIIFFITVGVTRYVSLGSILSSIGIPFYMFLSGEHYSYVIASALLCILIVAKHKSNIKRLITRSERKVFNKK